MSATLTLVRHSLRRSRGLVLAALLVLAGVEVLFVFAANAFQSSGTFSNLAAMVPPFMRQAFGESMISFMSYTGFVAFGYFHPMIVAALVGLVIAVATEPVGDIETHFLDLVLARPVPRPAVLGRSAVLVLLLPALVVLVMVVASLLALRWLVPPGTTPPRAVLIIDLAANLWALLVCIGAVALAVGAAARRRSTAVAIVTIAMLVLFVFDYVARVWKPATHVAWLSPFHYHDAMSIVMGGRLPLSHLAVLLSAAGVAIGLAFVLFSRRDL